MIVAGRSERDPRLGEALAGLADALALPLLADPLSGARRGPAAVAHYDALLREPEWAAAHAPDLVLRVGDLPTSKPLRQWLHGLDGALQIAFDAENAWQDPAGAVATIVAPTRAVLGDRRRPREGPRLAGGVDARGSRGVGGDRGDAAGPSEPRVAAELGVRLPPEATLVVASSMPVRDVESFFPVREQPPRVLSNRGANGIDGTVSTAFGVAASGAKTVLLIGDVALAHDIGGLLAARRLGLELTIVLLNNDGGGIFHFLPVAREGADFEEHVATPHGLDFAHAAALYGLAHEPCSRRSRSAPPSTARPARRSSRSHSDRDGNLDLHRRVTQAVVAVRPRARLACRACNRA